MIKRKFAEDGDIDSALFYVSESDGIDRAKALALFHAQRAVNAISRIPESEERNGLIALAHVVLDRTSSSRADAQAFQAARRRPSRVGRFFSGVKRRISRDQ